MNKIKIRYSHNNEYPWRVLDVTNNVLYHSKNLNMHGTFVGSGSQILAYGTYTTSPTSIKIATIADGSKIKEIQQIDEINIFSHQHLVRFQGPLQDMEDLPIEDSSLIKAICAKCSQPGYTALENLRAPYYCLACK